MTYSRPTTSTVSALFLPSKPQEAQGVDRQTVAMGRSGRLLDFSSAEQVGKNAGQGLNELSTFLGKALEVGEPVYKAYAEGQGKKQAAEFLKTVDVASLYRVGDKDQRNMLSSLNVYGQQIVADSYAKYAGRAYLDSVDAMSSLSPILRDPNSTAEQRQAEGVKIRGLAREGSGIDRVPAASLATILPAVMEGEAGIRTGVVKTQMAAEQSQLRGQSSQGHAAEFREYDGKVSTLRDTPGEDGTVDPTALVLEYHGKLKKRLDDLVTSGVSTYAEGGQDWLAGQFLALDGFRVTNNWDGLDNALLSLGTVMSKDLLIDGPNGSKVNFWDLRVGDGTKTIRQAILGRTAELQPLIKEAQEKAQLDSMSVLFSRIAAGGADADKAREELRIMMPQLSAENQGRAMTLVGQAQQFSETPTNEQDVNFGRLLDQKDAPGMTRERFSEMVNGANITQKQRNSLLTDNKPRDNPTIQLVAGAREYNKDQTGRSALAIWQSSKDKGWVTGDPKDSEGQYNAILYDLQVNASKQTEARISSIIKSGKTVTSLEAAEIYNNELEALTKSRLKDAGAQAPSFLNAGQRVMGEQRMVQQSLVNSGGKETLSLFPKSVLDAARANGVPMDYRSVRRFFLNNLRVVKDAKGAPMYPEPDKTWRQMVEQGRKARGGAAPAPQQQQSTSGQSPLRQVVGNPALNAVPGIAPLRGFLRVPEPASPPNKPSSGGDQSKAKPLNAGDMARGFVNGGLAVLAGVIAPPAAAAEGPGGPRGAAGSGGGRPRPAAPIRNEGGLDAMAQLWMRQNPPRTTGITMQTPPLPQVAASAPAAVVPVAISNPNHPFFLAIGIAEGTRTPDGRYTRAWYGHTDPGSGAANTGTISRQNGGPPAVEDRKALGELTRVQVAVAPRLQALGLKPGTVAYNRLMFNILDLHVQAPAALNDPGGFMTKLQQVVRQGATIEAIAKARADSFINPATGRLEASGFQNSYSRLLSDQRSRAGAFDYKKRL